MARLRGALRGWSLRLRILGAVLLATLAPQLLVLGWSQLERPIPGDLWRTTLDAADAAAALVAARGEVPRDDLARLSAARHVRVRVLDERGDVALDLDADDPTDALHPIESFFFGARGGPSARELDDPQGPLGARPEVDYARREGLYIACAERDLLVCQGVRATADARGAARVVHVEKSSARAVQEVYALRARLARLGLVTMPLGLLLAAWSAKRVTSPLARMRDDALAKARSAARGVALEETSDEVGDTTAALNVLLVAMARRREEEAAVAADLVHAMKSPVAAVRAGAEALAGPIDAERSARLARALGDSAARLDDLVTKYLALARVEAGMPREERKHVDLGALARATVRHASEDPRHAHVAIACDVSGAVTVFGVEGRIVAAIEELVDNAASYAATAVRVEVRGDRDAVVLEVVDDGPGIAPEDVPRVFERFFTTRGARRGTGLGLALVRAVALAHGGDVEALSDRAGATLRLRLPRG